MTDLIWNELDSAAVDTARLLAADAVEKVGNGHPGTAMSLAPVAYLLLARFSKPKVEEERRLARELAAASGTA